MPLGIVTYCSRRPIASARYLRFTSSPTVMSTSQCEAAKPLQQHVRGDATGWHVVVERDAVERVHDVRARRRAARRDARGSRPSRCACARGRSGSRRMRRTSSRPARRRRSTGSGSARAREGSACARGCAREAARLRAAPRQDVATRSADGSMPSTVNTVFSSAPPRMRRVITCSTRTAFPRSSSASTAGTVARRPSPGRGARRRPARRSHQRSVNTAHRIFARSARPETVLVVPAARRRRAVERDRPVAVDHVPEHLAQLVLQPLAHRHLEPGLRRAAGSTAAAGRATAVLEDALAPRPVASSRRRASTSARSTTR